MPLQNRKSTHSYPDLQSVRVDRVDCGQHPAPEQAGQDQHDRQHAQGEGVELLAQPLYSRGPVLQQVPVGEVLGEQVGEAQRQEDGDAAAEEDGDEDDEVEVGELDVGVQLPGSDLLVHSFLEDLPLFIF